MLSRIQILSSFGLAAALALSTTSISSAQNMTTQLVASGLARPLYVTAAPGDTSRIFIVEQRSGSTGRVRIFDFGTNTLLATPYLSITAVATANEQGLLGFALDPNYATNGYSYISFNNSGGTSVVQRYTVMAGNPNIVDPASVYPIISVAQPFSNHNGGWIGFGPDNDLYFSLGDGGSEGDPNHIGQNMSSLLSKMLRIDVTSDDFPGDSTKNYHIPANNPFVGTGTVPEAWLVGLRNPWRCSFDRGTGDMYIGDVGQNTYEEIDYVAAGQSGKNFGWSCMEASHCYSGGVCTCGAANLTVSIAEYSHTGGLCSVTGGNVYRGSAICGLQGTYFYADYCTGRIFSFPAYTGSAPVITERTSQLAPAAGGPISQVSGFGEDASGEIYICDLTGKVFKLVPHAGGIIDCNHNGIDDSCDIYSHTSLDANNDGIPDECQPSATPYCFGDGSGLACPCGNSGTAGNGCANSVNAGGANLAPNGVSSLSNDSLIIIGTGMPNSSCLYFQGTTQLGGGQGVVFGDGLRCAGGSVIRLGTKLNSGGTSQYPEILDLQISIKGGITSPPTTRTYQVWYRNPAAFCAPETFNLSNGLSVVWGT